MINIINFSFIFFQFLDLAVITSQRKNVHFLLLISMPYSFTSFSDFNIIFCSSSVPSLVIIKSSANLTNSTLCPQHFHLLHPHQYRFKQLLLNIDRQQHWLTLRANSSQLWGCLFFYSCFLFYVQFRNQSYVHSIFLEKLTVFENYQNSNLSN